MVVFRSVAICISKLYLDYQSLHMCIMEEKLKKLDSLHVNTASVEIEKVPVNNVLVIKPKIFLKLLVG